MFKFRTQVTFGMNLIDAPIYWVHPPQPNPPRGSPLASSKKNYCYWTPHQKGLEDAAPLTPSRAGRRVGRFDQKVIPHFVAVLYLTKKSDIATYLAIAITMMPDEFNMNETLQITRQPKLGLPLSRIFIWGIPPLCNQLDWTWSERNKRVVLLKTYKVKSLL